MKSVSLKNISFHAFNLYHKWTRNCGKHLLVTNNCRGLAVDSVGGINGEINIRDSKNIKQINNHFQILNSNIKNLNKISKVEVENILEKVTKDGCNKEQGVLILRCIGEIMPDLIPQKRAELTLSAWTILKNTGTVTLEHYQAMLSSLAVSRHSIFVDDIISEIKQNGLEPDTLTYERLLQCVCAVGDTVQATKIISLMKKAGEPVNQAILNAVILGHGRAGDLKKVGDVLEIMETSFISSGPATYTAILQSAAEAADESMFSSYFNKYHVELSDQQRLDIVKSLSVGNLFKFIPKVLKGGAWKTADIKSILINTIVELLHLGQLDGAYLIIKTLPDSIPSNPNSEASFALFFIQEMVKVHTPVPKIVKVCDDLQSHNPFALLKATETALQYSSQEIAVSLLNILIQRGHKLRPHYFWPLFVAAGKHNSEAEAFNVLDLMLSMDVVPDNETMAEWFLIHCNLSQPMELVRRLQDKGLSMSFVLTPVVTALLFSGRLKDAASVCDKCQGHLEWKKLFKPLVTEFFKTKDVSSFTKIFQKIKDSAIGNELIHYSVLQKRVQYNADDLSTLVKIIENAGFEISAHVYDAVNAVFSGKKHHFTNNNNNSYTPILHPSKMNVGDLEAHLIELKSKGMNVRGTLRRLLQHYCRNRNIKKALQIKKEFDDCGFKISAGMLTSLIDVYIAVGQLKEAEDLYSEVREKFPNFKVDNFRIIDLADLLVKSNRYQDAVNLLKSQEEVKAHESFLKNCLELLNDVGVHEGPERTKETFDLLIEKNYCTVSNVTLGPLVSSYILRKDFENAVKVLGDCASAQKCTPMLYSLVLALADAAAKSSPDFASGKFSIYDKEVEKDKLCSLLKKTMDIATKTHGPEKANVSLFVALAECGLKKQVMKLLKGPSAKLHTVKFIKKCNRLVDENKPEVLKTIISLIKAPDLKVSLYESLLKVYVRRGDCDSALSLWTEIQDDNLQASKTFLSELESFLISNDRKVPFVTSQTFKKKGRIENGI